MESKNNKQIIKPYSEITIKVPFYDLDPLNIAWHGNYIKYLEDARCSLLDKINYDYESMKSYGYAWPIIELHIKYVAPLTFMQQILVSASIVEYENSMKIKYIIKDSKTNKILTRAYTKQVAFNMTKNTMCLYSPTHFIEKIKKYKN